MARGYSVTVKGGKKLALLAQRVRRAQSQPVEIEIGIFASATYPSGMKVAAVGAIHEFGAPRAGIPERSWFRSAIPALERAAKAIIRRRVNPRDPVLPQRVADEIGAVGVDILQRSVTDLQEPALSPRTIAIKGSSNPLLDTGQMRASITWVVR